MKLLLLTVAIGLLSVHQADAGCYGTKRYANCNDYLGNSYRVQRHGRSTTFMSGQNSRTGERWSRESRSIGNTTILRGRDRDGTSWYMQERKFGPNRSWYGSDSNGNSFSGRCVRNDCW